ncbi:NAD(P)H-binding protein (plasmid) [Aliirhizobium terrae]|uniref:NAD(P)H-binding protein n=1 Tax=Terrirhizobium terrae TaxID=2926709 RepID=UPI0025785ECE|nr:NAD(P)H-binding protein [Rhizobium sp. CC-CFT758]WJH38628.1 NAD(P)H-binding protein [Rhizobium sp. CC-CFT758]
MTCIVLAATGNIGSQVVQSLKASNENVLAVTHDNEKAHSITGGEVEGVAVDLKDTDALRDVFRRGKRAFLLVPQAPPTTDTNTEELRTANSIADAVEGSGLEKVMVVSTYGAQEGHAIGDLSVLWKFERQIKATGVAMAVNRGAYYFTNIDMLIEPAKKGELSTPFPENLVMPRSTSGMASLPD